MLEVFAQDAASHPKTDEEFKKRLKLAALAGYLIAKEYLKDINESDKDALKIGQWAAYNSLELLTILALSPEKLKNFKLEKRNAQRAIISSSRHLF